MSHTLEERLTKIERRDAELLKLFPALAEAAGNAMYMSDFMIIGAIKRTLSLSKGFRIHIRDRNFICAGTLMRAMLDTALRLNALGLVRDPEALAGAITGGERMDKIRDRNDHKLTDAHLSKKLGDTYPWVPEVYSQLCGLGHFSNRHIFASVSGTPGDDGTISFSISADDPERPDEDYFEVVECFHECMRITGVLAHKLHSSKRMLLNQPTANSSESSMQS